MGLQRLTLVVISAAIVGGITTGTKLVISMSQHRSQDPVDRMFIQNANLSQTRPHHMLFLRTRPYRGELPTAAGTFVLVFCKGTLRGIAVS